MRIIYTSWSALEAAFEIAIFQKLDMEYQWLDAYNHQPQPNDLFLTTNGYSWRQGPFKKASLYAESSLYLPNEYKIWFTDRKWNHRFHFIPHYASFNNCSLQNIGCWWLSELPMFDEINKAKKPEFTFGMVLGKKKEKQEAPIELGYMRSMVVVAGKGRSFKYFGTNWPQGDPNYGGEVYISGARHSPVKFNDARRLMAKAKFVFCLENIYDKHYSVNYLTEKIFHAFLSSSVPIYCGCFNVEQLIDPSLFIDLRKFDMNPAAAMDYCEKMSDVEYQGYQERIATFIHGPAQAMSCDQRFVALDRKIKTIFGKI